MERRPLSQMIMIALVSAIVYGGASRQANTPEPPKSAAPAKATASPPPPVEKNSFHGGEQLLIAACDLDWVKAIRGGKCGNGLTTLVVTLPDPYVSHLDWSYDANLEAVRRAIETTGYVIDRFSLPDSQTVNAPTSGHFIAAGTELPRTMVEPGVMLYRPRDWGSRPLLLVYLVGEVPTSGLHKHAFIEALSERKALLGKLGAADNGIRIVGPTFSGSTPSMALALETYVSSARDTSGVLVATGSASDPKNGEILRTRLPRLSFVSTINNDAALDAVRDEFVLPRFLRKKDAIAILTEAGTAYGEQRRSRWIGGADSIRVITVPFPLNIADFREGYHKSEQPEGTQKLPGTGATENVNLNLNANPRGRETPAATSDVTPASTDAMMHEILSTLRRNRVRAVVLHATDVRDKLFLARIIRQELKDVQLITYESNALYGRSEFNRTLRGMIVLSSYPLILENQDWTDWSRSYERISFPSETAEGIYNAVLVQLGSTNGAIEYGAPAQGNVAGFKAPPVWITAVGAHSMLPVATHQKYSNADGLDLTSSAAPADTHEVGFVWSVTTLLLLSIAFSSAVQAIWAMRKKTRTLEWREAMRRQEVPELYIDIFAILTFFAVVILVAPMLTVLLSYTNYAMKMTIMTFLALAAGAWTIAFVQMLWPVLLSPKRQSRRAIMTSTWKYISAEARYGSFVRRSFEVVARFSLLAFGVIMLVCTIQNIIDMKRLDDVSSGPLLLFAYRALQMDSGLSPILPIMLVAAGLLAWCLWHRERVRELRESSAAEEMLLEESVHGVEQLRETIAEFRRRLVLVMPLNSQVIAAAVLAIIGVSIIVFGRGSLEWLVLERRHFIKDYVAFDIIFRGGLIAMLCAATWAILRLLICWKALRNFLAAVAETRYVWSLADLPAGMRRKIRPSLITINSQKSMGRIANQQWQALAKATSAVIALPEHQAPDGIEDVERVTYHKWWSGGESPIVMASRLAGVQKVVSTLWAADPRSLPLDVFGKDDRKTYMAFPHRPETKEWRRLAEEFVAGQIVYYIDWAQGQLRRIAYFILISSLLGIALVSSYPFQPQSIFKALLAVLIAGAMASIIYVTREMNRDPVLSTIGGTEAGAFNWNGEFVMNVVLYAVVPLLTLLSSEFPMVRAVVFSWAEPLFRSLAKF